MKDQTQVLDEMSKRAVSVTSSEDLYNAFAIMRRMAVRHVPVVDNGVLVGMVSDRDLFRRGSLRDGELVVGRQRVAEIMSTTVMTCRATDSLGDVALTMASQKVDALPVVNEEGAVLGIITSTDLLRHLFQPRTRTDLQELLSHKLQRFDFTDYSTAE